MSGLEAPGVVLAILPLLISAIENYDHCLSPFTRFNKFSREAGRFIKLFKIQKAIFHNQCRILLEKIVEQDEAASMLRVSKHPSWHNPKLEDEVVKLLNKSKEACIATIELIGEKLSEIRGHYQDLVEVTRSRDMIEDTSGSNVKLKRRIATKARFSFSKPRLDQAINDLRALNHDFITLASQTIESYSAGEWPSGKVSKEVEIAIQKYSIVARASRQVYKALGQACTKHVEHLAHTCAEVECSISKDGSSPQVKFRMALAGYTDQKDPISFILHATLDEAVVGNREGVIPGENGLGSKLKQHLQISSNCAEPKAKKSVHFESPVIESASKRSFITIADPFTLKGRLKRDFCDHLRRCRSQPIESHGCIGTLETFEGGKNTIFLGRTSNQSQSQQAVLLDQLIASSSRQKRYRVFQLHERLHLAKLLTIAVLQYRSTPWLQMSWKSNDVVFFGIDVESLLDQESALTAPHFNARVSGHEEPLNSGKMTNCASGARNSLLYSLGIVLLEIAYWTNWENLNRPSEDRDRYSDFYQARSLLKSGCSDMGRKYDQIVEQLIECDFGSGDDLSTDRLQLAVYRDVVCPLEKLELGLKALQAGCSVPNSAYNT